MKDKEMIINNILAHKKNFGIYKDLDGKEILFYTTGGNFASDAWIASGGQNTGDVLAEPSWLLQLMTAASGIWINMFTQFLRSVFFN